MYVFLTTQDRLIDLIVTVVAACITDGKSVVVDDEAADIKLG